MEFAVALASVLAAVVGLTLFATVSWLVKSNLRGKARLPPVKSGWIPWVGCAIQFGKEPLWFIQQTRKELGDIFTIYAAGKRMTFITNPRDYSHYFQTTLTDFQAAVQPFTKKAAGLSSKSFFKYHSAIHDTIKGRLVPNYITKLCPILSQEFYRSLCYHGEQGEMDLMDFVRDAMFESVVRQLFGEDNVPQTRKEMLEFQQAFVKYDADFEYGAELPEIFLKDWSKSKYRLLSLFKLIVEGIQERRQKTDGESTCTRDKTLVEHLIDAIDHSSAHNYALLLLWASQANAVPIVFWAMTYILANPDIYMSLKKDVENIPLKADGNDFCPISEATLKSVMSVKRCVLEAIRLHAPGMITRKVTRTHTVSGYTIPSGHLMMLSPYWSHRNPEKFSEPERFNPDRWLECDLERNQFLDGFVGFGGGRYQCPGRWFALAEMHLFIVIMIRMFELKELDPIPLPVSSWNDLIISFNLPIDTHQHLSEQFTQER